MRKKRNVRRSRRIREVRPPLRRGINASRIVLPDGDWATLGQWAHFRFGDDVWEAFRHGDFLADGAVVLGPDTPYVARSRIWIFRPVLDEPDTPIALDVLAENERFIVVDKPHGMATIPRGSHVANTVTVAARRQFANDELVCAHRLDLETAGLVLLTKKIEYRSLYQDMFQRREIAKEYAAIATASDLFADGAWHHFQFRLGRPPGQMHVDVLDDCAPLEQANGVTDVRMLEYVDVAKRYAHFILKPTTGYTHQLRTTMNHVGAPIFGDPLYPVRLSLEDEAKRGHFLKLLAARLSFIDPVDKREYCFESRQRLELPNGY
ncbi:tRNA pseudouridine32 synthase/23S rRNA pseudouridine746 synthase [Arcanobacterium pluranimalium]|uniref:pseudouridine synthase n=1 Tax=Arcanobacterium pluranimalium TaxID=108028 RepID=UPI0019581387|nr:pseudouridine synthase [Arcanobacterium pluranimalium]MBM7825020.1 tRNA pseudouridine32 synthase/23S rRNA pseudouridine746 synthase [Arcanobacterium pluranimalium]